MAVDPDFVAYVAARRPALVRFAVALTGGSADAEDLVQTALAKVAVKWSSVRRRDRPDAYVRRTIVRLHINRWRRLLSREHPAADPVELAAPSDDADTRHVVWEALATLPPRQRAVIVLRYYEDLSEAEIADVLGCAPGTVKSQAAKALARLRTMTGLRDLTAEERRTP